MRRLLMRRLLMRLLLLLQLVSHWLVVESICFLPTIPRRCLTNGILELQLGLVAPSLRAPLPGTVEVAAAVAEYAEHTRKYA